MMISFVICVRLDAPWTELHKLFLPILWAVIKVLALVTRVAVGALSRPAFGVVFLAEGTGLLAFFTFYTANIISLIFETKKSLLQSQVIKNKLYQDAYLLLLLLGDGRERFILALLGHIHVVLANKPLTERKLVKRSLQTEMQLGGRFVGLLILLVVTVTLNSFSLPHELDDLPIALV